jgi:pilus assembly protein CpaE
MTGKKILIVDADVTSRNFIVRSLSQQNYEVIQSDSAKEGLIFSWRDRPDLVIIDPKIPDLAGEDFAKKLRQDARTANMPLIALSADQSPQRVKSCLDAGFNEYITKSGNAVAALNEAIHRLLNAPSSAAPVPSNIGRQGGLLITFLSAKGGVGTSSLCANIAMQIARQEPQSNVVVLDMVLPIGSIAPIVGYTEAQNVVTISKLPSGEATPEFFRNLAFVRNWGFHLLAGSPDPESSHHLKVDRVADIVNVLKASYDYVLVDVGRSLSNFTLPLIQHADLVTLVLGTDLSAATLTKTMFGYLHGKGVGADAIFAILNRAVGLEGLNKTEVEKILDLQVKCTIPYLGGNLTFANNQHAPFSDQFPNDVGAYAFREIAKDMALLARKLRA